MALDPSGGWALTTAGTYTVQIRDDIDAAFGYAVDYVGTIEGAWTLVMGELAFRVEQGAALAIQSTDARQATGAALDRIAWNAGKTRKPATRSRYIARFTGTTGVTVPAGSLLQSGAYQWSVLEDVVLASPYTSGTIEAIDSGPIALGSSVTFAVVTPVSGWSGATYASAWGGDFQLGRIAETDGQLRARVITARGRPGDGSPEAIRGALLELPWVQIASADGSAGEITLYVYPGPLGADQTQELAESYYRARPAGITMLGAESTTIVGVDGQDVTVNWEESATENLDIAVTVTTDASMSSENMEDAVSGAIAAYLQGLGPGATVYYSQLYAAIGSIVGVLHVDLLLDGTSNDFPASTAVTSWLFDPITITVTT